MSEFTVEFRIRCEAEFADSVTSHMGMKASHERYYDNKFIWVTTEPTNMTSRSIGMTSKKA
jgi:hypothetical protein